MTSSRQSQFLTSLQLTVWLQNARGTRLCDQTVRNWLHAACLQGRRPCVSIPLTHHHHQDCISWAMAHQRWVRRQWNKVLFTDKSQFNLYFADARLQVWRGPGEHFDQANIFEVDRFGSGGVIFWGGIWHRVKTNLIQLLVCLHQHNTAKKWTQESFHFCASVMQSCYSMTVHGLLVQTTWKTF